MPKSELSAQANNTSPDYIGLVKFLLEPFLEDPQSLSIDCEEINSSNKVWLRVAFNSDEKGKVFGRGGRNIHAIRTVLNTAAAIAGKSVHLEIYSEDKPKQNQTSDRRRKNGIRKQPSNRRKPRYSHNHN